MLILGMKFLATEFSILSTSYNSWRHYRAALALKKLYFPKRNWWDKHQHYILHVVVRKRHPWNLAKAWLFQ